MVNVEEGKDEKAKDQGQSDSSKKKDEKPKKEEMVKSFCQLFLSILLIDFRILYSVLV